MNNSLRITGMATGMDTDATVKQLMKPYNMKFDKLKQNKQTMQWKQDMYRDIIKDLRDLKNTYLTIDSPDATNMVKVGSFSTSTITSSNENIVTAIGMPGALSGVSKVTVKEVAQGAKIAAPLKTTSGSNPSASTKMSDLGFKGTSTITLECGKGTTESPKETFTVNIDPSKTVQDFINDFNSAKEGSKGDALYSKVQISFSELTGSLKFETRNTGDNQALKISATSTEASTDCLDLFNKVTSADGKNASVLITPPGETTAVPVPFPTPNNTFTIDNISYSIDPNYVVPQSGGNPAPETVTLTTKPDAQKSVDKIKGFVDKYNAIVDKMYSKYSEKKQYKYVPLTDEQKKDMKEDDIKKWDAKAKEGLIKNDEEIGRLLTSMRSAVFGPVTGAGISLQEIGLDSRKGFESTTKPGQIVVDEKKLKAALETRGDQVMNLFTSTPDPKLVNKPEKDKTQADKTEIFNTTGIFKRLQDTLYDSVIKTDGSFLKKAGFEGTYSNIKNDLTDNIKKQDTVIAAMEKKLATQEDAFYKRFAMLEKYMNAMNSQSNWLTAQLGGGK